MNRKQFQILVVLGLIVGGCGLWVLRSQKNSYKTTDATVAQKVFTNFPLNDVAGVRIKQSSTEINLQKVEEVWRVKERSGYPANFTEVSDLLRNVWELKPMREEKVGESQLERLELNLSEKATNSGMLVEFQDKDGKTLQSLTLGKKYTRSSGDSSPMGGGGFPVGRYVRVPDAKLAKVYLVGETFESLDTKPDRWLNKDFFKIEKIKSVSVTTNNAIAWHLSREKEGGELKLADVKEGEVLDQSKAGGPGNSFSFPSFNDVLGTNAAMTNLTLAKIETFENFTYNLRIGKTSSDDTYQLSIVVEANYPKERIKGTDEKPEDKEKLDKEFQEGLAKLDGKLKTEKALEKWVFEVSKYVVEPLLKQRKDLFAEMKDDKKPNSAVNPLSIPGLPPDFPGISDTK